MAHSKGPWRVELDEREYVRWIVADDGARIACLDASNDVGGGMDEDVTLEGDATLMAAGPTLLAALTDLLGEGDLVWWDDEQGQRYECKWCGREYPEIEDGKDPAGSGLCSADDCPGNIARAAIAAVK